MCLVGEMLLSCENLGAAGVRTSSAAGSVPHPGERGSSFSKGELSWRRVTVCFLDASLLQGTRSLQAMPCQTGELLAAPLPIPGKGGVVGRGSLGSRRTQAAAAPSTFPGWRDPSLGKMRGAGAGLSLCLALLISQEFAAPEMNACPGPWCISGALQ